MSKADESRDSCRATAGKDSDHEEVVEVDEVLGRYTSCGGAKELELGPGSEPKAGEELELGAAWELEPEAEA